jgi:hypothetical protein
VVGSLVRQMVGIYTDFGFDSGLLAYWRTYAHGRE